MRDLDHFAYLCVIIMLITLFNLYFASKQKNTKIKRIGLILNSTALVVLLLAIIVKIILK